MQSDNLPAKSQLETQSQLSQLIESFGAARDAGDPASAFRIIDRARRLAPGSPEISHIYGHSLLGGGEPEQALEFFDKAAHGRSDPAFEAAVIQTLSQLERDDQARERLEKALAQFAFGLDNPLAEVARRMARKFARNFRGWAAIGPDLTVHGEVLGQPGQSLLLEFTDGAGGAIHHAVIFDRDQYLAPFNISLGDPANKQRWWAKVGNDPLIGGNIAFPQDFGLDGRATVDDRTLTGWVKLRWLSSRPITLTLTGASNFSLQVTATRDPLEADRQLFGVARESYAAAGNEISIWVDLPDGSRVPLPDSPLLIKPNKLPSRKSVADRDEARKSSPKKPKGTARKIDIVIPVYAGYDETLACIDSVISTVGSDAEIVVIDDCSPEPRLVEALGSLETRGAITLLRNPQNEGFPKTANRGMTLHDDRDVVVLNSDTEVYGDWLARLRAAAYRTPDTGTVTPFSNAASIASYPKSEEPEMSSDEAAHLDRLTASLNAGVTVSLPTGVGFCLFIRRDCLAQIGPFDLLTFGKGYGEENDFCLRAAKLGWKDVLAADVYVRHVGSRSFGSRRSALLERNLRLLNLRHKGYDEAVRAYTKADPAHRARRRLDEARLIAAKRDHVLLVSLALEGGVRRAVDERAAQMTRQGRSPVILKPDDDDVSRCRLTVCGAVYDDLHYDLSSCDDGELAALVGLIGSLTIQHIELHHFLGLPEALIEALRQLGHPLDVWVHDYIWYCPRVNLMGRDDTYCGEPDLASCQNCIDTHGGRLPANLSVAALRERSARWLASARAVIVPTLGVATKLQSHFAGLNPRIQPLEPEFVVTPIERSRGARLKVAVLGAIGDHKGYYVLLAQAKDAAARDLPIDFVVIGFTMDDAELMATGRVFVTGRYEERELDGLIRRERPDVALFLSVFPETWCYTLTYALRAGLPVAAFDHGAISDRLRDSTGEKLLFPLSIAPAKLNDQLLRAFAVSQVEERPSGSLPGAMDPLRSPAESQIVAQGSASSHEVNLSRSRMVQKSNGLSANVELLPLAQGLYLFSVRSAQARRVGENKELLLPAMQVGTGPGNPAGAVEFMYGPNTQSAWLCEPSDNIVIKVKQPTALLFLTSVVAQGMVPLEIEVKRLDNPSAARAQPAGARQAPGLPPQAPAQPPRQAPKIPVRGSMRFKIVAHIQNRGDVEFPGTQWAGFVGQRLAIEAFTITLSGAVSPDIIEYKGVTANGVETPWVTGGASCGTRGIGVPLIGFAIRAKADSGTPGVTCDYGAMLVSGATIGPAREGGLCTSLDHADPIESIWVALSGPAETTAERFPVMSEPAPAPEKARPKAPPPPRERQTVGPRFSVFREPTED